MYFSKLTSDCIGTIYFISFTIVCLYVNKLLVLQSTSPRPDYPTSWQSASCPVTHSQAVVAKSQRSWHSARSIVSYHTYIVSRYSAQRSSTFCVHDETHQRLFNVHFWPNNLQHLLRLQCKQKSANHDVEKAHVTENRYIGQEKFRA